MTILGIETSNIYLSLAIEKDGDLLLNYCERVPMRHSEAIFPVISQLFNQVRISPQDLDRIGVSIGPGMFTSLRIGLALAKGLAYPYHIPVVPVNTLDALSLPYLGLGDYVMPITDARRGLLYTALYDRQGRKGNYLLVRPNAIGDLIMDMTIVIGDGVNRYPEILKKSKDRILVPDPNPVFPDGPIIIRLAHKREPVVIETLEPFYLKKSDAEIDHPARNDN